MTTNPTARPDVGRWVVLREAGSPRWGGEQRRHHIFAGLAEITGATIEDGWTWREIRHGVFGPLWRLRGRFPNRGVRPRLASSEALSVRGAELVARIADPVAVAIYDDGVAQARALGVLLSPEREADIRARRAANVAAFRWQVAPTASFAELTGLDPSRLIVGGNGTDTGRIRPVPWPDQPAIGFASGAAPGRGIETLIEATRLARSSEPELRLLLLLVTTGAASEAYLDALRQSTATDPWIEIGTAPPDRLSDELGRASVLCIPHPPNEYMDVALPVKLFDSMAAGRPVVATPRLETAAIIRRHGVGLVTTGDRPEDLATAFAGLLANPVEMRRMGAVAREVAEREFDWRVGSRRIARAVLAREGWDLEVLATPGSV